MSLEKGDEIYNLQQLKKLLLEQKKDNNIPSFEMNKIKDLY